MPNSLPGWARMISTSSIGGSAPGPAGTPDGAFALAVAMPQRPVGHDTEVTVLAMAGIQGRQIAHELPDAIGRGVNHDRACQVQTPAGQNPKASGRQSKKHEGCNDEKYEGGPGAKIHRRAPRSARSGSPGARTFLNKGPRQHSGKPTNVRRAPTRRGP